MQRQANICDPITLAVEPVISLREGIDLEALRSRDLSRHYSQADPRVSPLVGLSSQGFTVCKAALKVASCKVTKHEKTCIKSQHLFIPFAFDTFGFLALETVQWSYSTESNGL
uniref:Auxilin-like protein n=1 Tax=Tanacetum cinerariifolium TaxID=118510 RepID=A0A6L2J843_TANCI|nr:auxilin-like protein [Tanacetum cinerariifolium]